MALLDVIRGWFRRLRHQDVLALSPAGPNGEGEGEPQFDIDAIVGAAGVDDRARGHVTKAQELLRTMPREATPAVERQVVEAAFKAFGISSDEIVAAASAEIEALHAFVTTCDAETTKRLGEAAERIERLEASIRDERERMRQLGSAQHRREVLAEDAIARVQPVLRFFVDGSAPAPAREESADLPALPEAAVEEVEELSAEPSRRELPKTIEETPKKNAPRPPPSPAHANAR